MSILESMLALAPEHPLCCIVGRGIVNAKEREASSRDNASSSPSALVLLLAARLHAVARGMAGFRRHVSMRDLCCDREGDNTLLLYGQALDP